MVAACSLLTSPFDVYVHALGPTEPPIQQVPNHSSLSSAKVMKEWSSTSISLCAFMAWTGKSCPLTYSQQYIRNVNSLSTCRPQETQVPACVTQQILSHALYSVSLPLTKAVYCKFSFKFHIPSRLGQVRSGYFFFWNVT